MLVEIFLVLLLVFTLIKFNQKPKGIPPGEWGLPIVGYIPFMSWKVADTLRKLEKKHGRIFSMKLGTRLFIVICDYSLLKTAFNKVEISGRPYLFSLKTAFYEYYYHGIVNSVKHRWETNRKFAMKTLKEFGMGKSRLEEFINTEAEYLVKTLKESVNKPITVDWNLNVAIVNTICRLVANRRYNINDKEIKEFTQNIFENIEDMEGLMAIFNLLPWMEYLIPNYVKKTWMKVGVVEHRRKNIKQFLMNIIKEHKDTLDPTVSRDYIDQYLIEISQQKDNPDYAHCEDEDLYMTVFDFFAAGSETTSSTLRWFFAYMAKYQDIQKRVQREIDEVVPRDRLPSLQEKNNLPCLEALSYEISRKISLFPNGIAREVTENTILDGYQIPKGSLVVQSTESCHMDPKYWTNPTEFSLSHFLDQDGKFVAPKGSFVPFSIGRRQCVGESLAKMELFLFMGAILQNFSILEPEGHSISLEPDESVNLFNYPLPFEIVLKNRT